jgi:NAD-dependent deacetylase
VARSSIVVLTGPGICPDGGIMAAHEGDSFWERQLLEEAAVPMAYRQDPLRVQGFYNARRRRLAALEPTAAHRALAQLEAAWPGDFLLVTANADDLHERAGSRALIHLFGELLKVRCTECHHAHPWAEDLDFSSCCPSCATLGQLRPHLVWYGEPPLEMERIHAALAQCTCFLALGTPGHLHPAVGFLEEVPPFARTLVLSAEPGAEPDGFQERRAGPALLRVPELVAELLAGLA